MIFQCFFKRMRASTRLPDHVRRFSKVPKRHDRNGEKPRCDCSLQNHRDILRTSTQLQNVLVHAAACSAHVHTAAECPGARRSMFCARPLSGRMSWCTPKNVLRTSTQRQNVLVHAAECSAHVHYAAECPGADLPFALFRATFANIA